MNRDELKGSWHQLKGKVKEKWGKLTDDEITRIEGNYEQLIGTIQKRYGYAKDRAEQEVKNWHSSITATSGSATRGGRESTHGTHGGRDTTRGGHDSFGSDSETKFKR